MIISPLKAKCMSSIASLDPGVIRIFSVGYKFPVLFSKYFEIEFLSSTKPWIGKYSFLWAFSFSLETILSGTGNGDWPNPKL